MDSFVCREFLDHFASVAILVQSVVNEARFFPLAIASLGQRSNADFGLAPILPFILQL